MIRKVIREESQVLERRLQHMEEMMDKVDRSLEKIEMVTLFREPPAAAAADAYNGLRKQVIASVSERTSHLTQLAQFDAVLRGGATAEDLASLTREWLAQASLIVVEDHNAASEAFELVGEGNDASAVVRRPAYVDSITGRVVRMGVAERVAALPAVLVSPETTSESAAEQSEAEVTGDTDANGLDVDAARTAQQ